MEVKWSEKTPVLVTTRSGKWLAMCDSVIEASNKTGVSAPIISKIIGGKYRNKTLFGFIGTSKEKEVKVNV